MQTAQNITQPQSPFQGQQPVRGSYKTEQNFYKPPTSATNLQRPEPQHQPHPMIGNYGNYDPRSDPRSQQQQIHQYGGAMGMVNYNAFSQKEYDDLKEQFFRPPNMQRPLDHYNRMSEGTFSMILDSIFNFGAIGVAMGGTASSEMLPPVETSFNRPSSRQYP